MTFYNIFTNFITTIHNLIISYRNLFVIVAVFLLRFVFNASISTTVFVFFNVNIIVNAANTRLHTVIVVIVITIVPDNVADSAKLAQGCHALRAFETLTRILLPLAHTAHVMRW